MTRPELRSRLFSAAVTIGAVAAVLWFGLEGRRPALAPTWSPIEVGGRVTDALSGRPVPYAQVLIEQEKAQGPVTTYSNSRGLYSATLRAATHHFAARMTVRAVHYRDSVGDFKQSTDKGIVDLELTPFHEPAKPSSVTSPPVRAGGGAEWGSWTSLCLTSPPGSHLGPQVEFHLEGDRACGAWAECEPVKLSETEVCYRFRIQGHAGAQGQQNRTTQGVLSVAVEPGEVRRGSDTPRERGLAFIQYHGAVHRKFAEDAAAELGAAGFPSPVVTEVEMGFQSRVRYFRRKDFREAEAAAGVVRDFAWNRGLILQISLDDASPGNFTVRPGQIEVWIDLDGASRR